MNPYSTFLKVYNNLSWGRILFRKIIMYRLFYDVFVICAVPQMILSHFGNMSQCHMSTSYSKDCMANFTKQERSLLREKYCPRNK